MYRGLAAVKQGRRLGRGMEPCERVHIAMPVGGPPLKQYQIILSLAVKRETLTMLETKVSKKKNKVLRSTKPRICALCRTLS